MATEDTEITLGPVKLLGLFFLLAAICGVFFAIGYSLGRSTARDEALKDMPSQVLAAAPAPAPSSETADKPSAAVAVRQEIARPAPEPQQAATADSQSNLTFYKAVQQNSAGAQPPVSSTATDASKTSARETASPPSLEVPAAKESVGHGSPEVSRNGPVTGPGTIVVQIAALSREDDAVALAGALRRKNYNVFVVNNPVTNDKLYHVQVGPFATLQEADATKVKLTAEGYSPIVKR